MSVSDYPEIKNDIQIRDAIEHDYDSVIHVLQRAWEKYALLHPEISEALKQALVSYADPGPQERIIAELDGQIVGTAEIFHSSDEAYDLVNNTLATPILRRLAVLPEMQGKGIATQLIEESAKRALKAGVSSLYLHTSAESNPSAVRLYEQLGFTRSSDQDIRQGVYSMEGYRLDLSSSSLVGGGTKDEF